MTRLEAIKARVRVRPGPGWAGWVYHADDDRRWLLERLDELAKVLGKVAAYDGEDGARFEIAAAARMAHDALAKLDEP